MSINRFISYHCPSLTSFVSGRDAVSGGLWVSTGQGESRGRARVAQGMHLGAMMKELVAFRTELAPTTE